MKKRLVASLLLIVMLVGMLPTQAFATPILQPIVSTNSTDASETVNVVSSDGQTADISIEPIDSLDSFVSNIGSSDAIVDEPDSDGIFSFSFLSVAPLGETDEQEYVTYEFIGGQNIDIPVLFSSGSENSGLPGYGNGEPSSPTSGLKQMSTGLRLTITRFSGSNVSGIYDKSKVSGIQEAANMHLDALLNSSYKKIIIDLYESRIISCIQNGWDTIVSDHSAVDYRTENAWAVEHSVGPNSIVGDYNGYSVYKVNDNHYIVDVKAFERYLSSAYTSYYVGVVPNVKTDVITWTEGSDYKTTVALSGETFDYGIVANNSSMSAFIEPVDYGVNFSEDNNKSSIFCHIDKFLSLFANDFYSYVLADYEKDESHIQVSGNVNKFATAFHLPNYADGVNDFFYFMTAEPMVSHVQNPDSPSFMVVNTYRDTKSGLFDSNRLGRGMKSVIVNGLVMSQCAPLVGIVDTATKDITKATWSDFFVSLTDYGSYGMACGLSLWTWSGYNTASGGSSVELVTVRKEWYTNLPDDVLSQLYPGYEDGFKVTISFTGLTPNSNFNVYDSDIETPIGTFMSDGLGNGNFDADLQHNDTISFKYNREDKTSDDGSYDGALNSSAQMTVTEDLGDYAKKGMFAMIHLGPVPSGYMYNGAQSCTYASNNKYDEYQTSAHFYNDGLVTIQDNGIVSHTFDLSNESNGRYDVCVTNAAVGFIAAKTVDDTDGSPSESAKQYLETAKTAYAGAPAEFLKYYENADAAYPVRSYFYGVVFDNAFKGWCAGYPDSTWATVPTSDHIIIGFMDGSESTTIDGLFCRQGNESENVIALDDATADSIAPHHNYMWPFLLEDNAMLFVDPAFALHSLIASKFVGSEVGNGGVGIGEYDSVVYKYVAEEGGTDIDTGSYFTYSVEATTLPGRELVSGNNLVSAINDNKTVGSHLDSLIATDSGTFTPIKESISAKNPDALNQSALDGAREFPIALGDTGAAVYKVAVKNMFSSSSGKAHLVIDMNLNAENGIQYGPNGEFINIESASQVVQCGTHDVGDVVDLTDVNNKLTSMDKKLVASKPDENIYVYATPKGVFETPSGGEALDTYTIQHGDLTVLFVQWNFEIESEPVDCDDCDEDTGSVGSSKMYTAFWDYGYTNGGVASSQFGISTYYAEKIEQHWSISCGCPGANSDLLDVVVDYIPYTVTAHILPPSDPIRNGWTFLGWVCPDAPHKDFEIADNYYFRIVDKWNLYNDNRRSYLESLNLVPQDDNTIATLDEQFEPGKHTLRAYEQVSSKLLDLAAGKITNEEFDSYLSNFAGNAVTFRAVWNANSIKWHSMGGHYVDRSGDSDSSGIKDAAKFNGDQGVSDTHFNDWSGEHIGKNGVCETYILNGFQTPEEEFVPIASTPERTGYTFIGWFYDPYCSVPLIESEQGVQPDRNYYAGWQSEDVVINYYDTREGTQLLGTQRVSYNDAVKLLNGVNSTSGWNYVGWTVSPEGGDPLKPQDGQQWNEDFIIGVCGGEYVPVNGNVNDGSPELGTYENDGYWTLDLYAEYDIKTTTYTVDIHWDDFINNDGVRPKEITVGLITSMGNTVQETFTMTEANSKIDESTWSHTFTELPITVSDSNNDIINYSFCFLNYVDANGNGGEIKDTNASSGDILVTTPTDTSTDPTSSYTYAVSYYQDDGSIRSSNGVEALQNVTGFSDNIDNVSYMGSSDMAVTYQPYGGVLYMTHDLILTGDDIKFTIQWDDDSDRDGKRPESVMLYLYAKEPDGSFSLVTQGDDTLAGSLGGAAVAVTAGMCDVSEDGNTWVYTFKNYQKYTNKGDLITYAVGVTNVYDGYSHKYMSNDSPKCDTNGVVFTHVPERNDVDIVLNWHDEYNQDGLRPTEVTIQLISYQYNKGIGAYEAVPMDTAVVTGGSNAPNWYDVFEDEYVYNNGMPVIYRLKVISNLNGSIDDYSNGYNWTEGVVGNPKLDGVTPSVDIYHNVDERTVVATVQWADNYNNDGHRPESVILQLYANGVAVPGEDYRVHLKGDPTAATWTHTFEKVNIFTAGQEGKEIVYTVQVLSAQGGTFEDYTAKYINQSNNFVPYFPESTEPYVLLEYVDKVGDVTGKIYWEDEQNRDGERPDFVDVALMATVYDEQINTYRTYVAATRTLSTDAINHSTATEWVTVFEDMPIYRDTYPITYFLTITSDLDGNVSETAKEYSWEEKSRGDMDTTPDLEVAVTAYQQTEIMKVDAVVEWDDDNNNDGLRPTSVILQLYANGKRVEGEGYTVTLTGDPKASTWTHTFENLPRYEEGDSGSEIVYTIYAEELTEGTLYGKYEDVAITGKTYEFTKYTPYYVTSVKGEYSIDLKDSTESYVRLTHKNNQMDVPISIIWNDENNRDGQRPEFVGVKLMAYQWNESLYTWEYKEVATDVIKTDEVNHMTAGEWTDTFGLRDMYKDGVKVVYHLMVTSDLNAFLPEGSFEYGWVESQYGNQTDAIPQVTISQNTNTVSVEATVYWDDSQNNDDIRPTNIILQLYAHAPGETPVPVEGQAYRVNLSGDSTADNWYYTFSGMPKYAEGQSGVELIYTVQAIEVEGEPLYGTYVINSNGYEEEVVRYEASYLYENTETGKTENTSDANLSDRAYVKLSHVSETMTMNFAVNWHDDSNRDAVRPLSVSVDMYKTIGNGEPVYLKTLVINEGQFKNWTYQVTDLPGYENGEPVKYTIELSDDIKSELEKIGYSTSTEDNIVHMYYTPARGSISTQLYWTDESDNDGYRPDNVIATLYANGLSTGKTADLNETNGWSATWTDLNVHYVNGDVPGQDIVYNVVITPPETYTVTYNPESTTIEENEVLYINVNHTTDVMDVPITVYWNDNSNNDGKRPDSLRVMLLVDGAESEYSKVLTSSENADPDNPNVWRAVFEDMPVYRGNGEKIYYSVVVYDDATVNGEYTSLTAGTSLYLSHNPIMSEMYVSFQFNDGHNADGDRPTGLYLQLTADGVPVDDSEYKHTVSFDTNVDGHTWNFGELPVYKYDGTKIKYNVEVTFAPEFGAIDYDVWTSDDIELSESGHASVNQVIVKLSKAVDTTVLNGRVFWFDCNNMFGDRPETLNVILQNNYSNTRVEYVLNATTGVVTNKATGDVVGEVQVEEWTGDSSVWHYSISGVSTNYINDAGESAPIYYYVTANTTHIMTYYPTVHSGENSGMDVALTHRYYEENATQASQDFTVKFMWLDNENAWGYRPNSNGVKVDLLANGEVYDTIMLTSEHVVKDNANSWSYTFNSLPTFRNGSAVVWSVKAADVHAYTQESTTSTATAQTITFSQSFGFNFTVNWNDSNNDDGVRPDDLSLDVLADGVPVSTVVLTGDENIWTGFVKDMSVWRESDSDTAIRYTFAWSDETEEYLTSTGYTATPTLNGESVESTQFYYLSATEFGNNEDEGYNDLESTYEWETTLNYNKEVADYRFNVIFDDDVDRDGVRPESLTVNLLADGEKIDSRTIEINTEDSMYTLLWEDLEVYTGGRPIVYTMELESVPYEYVAEYNQMHTSVTLTHDVVLVDVTGIVNWDDASQLVPVYNSLGQFVRYYEQIARTDVNVTLLADGAPVGDSKLISKDVYGEGEDLIKNASVTWNDLHKYRDNGTEIDYTIKVHSDELTALLMDGHSLTYDFDTKYEPSATVTHEKYDIRGKVYYQNTINDDFLLEGVPVTAYLYNDDTGKYQAAGSAITNSKGEFEILNVPQGIYVVRATYVYGEQTLAGSDGLTLDRQDNSITIVVNRDASSDSDLYQYTAIGHAYYQTDAYDPSTITPVPEGSIVILRKIVDTQLDPVYVGMTTTTEDGSYIFSGLDSAEYIVNVVFNYNGSVYTFDNADAESAGLNFVITGADVTWDDIIKQVNAEVEPGEPGGEPEEPEIPEDKPEPCVISGDVFFSDAGVHTTDPVEGVDVNVYLKDNNVEVGHAVTDENGHWTMEGLTTADYIAVFSYKGNASRVVLFTISESDYEVGTYTVATQYFDRESDVSTSIIRGIVLDNEGTPVNAIVFIYDKNGTVLDFAYTDMQGYYNFTVGSATDYNVRIVKVEDEVLEYQAGDPDDTYTSLDYYSLSGKFAIDGVVQGGELVAVYYQDPSTGSYDLVTATLTDIDGNYTAKVYKNGNYRICPYVDEEEYAKWDISISYQDEHPQVEQVSPNSYTLSGIENYQSLILYKIVDGVEHVVVSQADRNENTYHIENLDSGFYRLVLTNKGTTKAYYVSCPSNLIVDVTYYVTVEGKVLDDFGNAVIGATASLYNSKNEQVGTTLTILSDGGYCWTGLPADDYKIVVTKPHSSEVLANKWTYEPDSYGVTYPDGIVAGKEWVWNINAYTVSGKVVDQYGEPVANASIVFSNESEHKSFVTHSNEDGTYKIGLAPDVYTVNCAYYFDEEHRYEADGYNNITLNSDVENFDFTFQRDKVIFESYRKSDSSMLPNADLIVTYDDATGNQVWNGNTGETGSVETYLFPAEYTVTGSCDGETAAQTFVVDGETTVKVYFDTTSFITGVVRDEHGEPLADAIVYYDNGSGNKGHVYVNDNGEYKISLKSDDLGTYTLYATSGVSKSDEQTVDVQTDTVVDITIDKSTNGETYSVTGVVTDEDGNRLENAMVTIMWGNDKTNTAVTSTNSNGEYKFDVVNGTYYLSAIYEAPNGNTYRTNADYTIHVNGAPCEQNLRVMIRYTVTVNVVDESGKPVANADIYYTGAEVGKTNSDATGMATLYLANGDYEFYATTESRTSDVVSVQVSGNTTVKLVLANVGISYEEPNVFPTELTIYGWVYNPEGIAVEGAQVILYKRDKETLEYSVVETITSNVDGYYEFPHLEDGVYRVDTEFIYTRVVAADGDDYVIKGVLTDDYNNPYSNVVVELRDAKTDDLITTITTGDDGSYEFVGLNGNTQYKLYAVSATSDVILNETVNAVAVGNRIEGVIRNVAGDVVPNAEIIIRDSSGAEVARAITGSNGYYGITVEGYVGPFSLTAKYPSSYEIDTETYERDTTDRNAPYIKESWYTIEGYVHDNDGNPVEGATVILENSEHIELEQYITKADGYYIFDELEDGIYYVKIVIDGETEHVYEVDTGTGDVTDVTPNDNINVTVTNHTNAVVTEPEGGWVAGNNEFIVDLSVACAVSHVRADGSYSRMYVSSVDESGYLHYFTGDFQDGDEIIITLKGDVNLDGSIDIMDYVRLYQFINGSYDLSLAAMFASNVDANDSVDIMDYARLYQFINGNFTFEWDIA